MHTLQHSFLLITRTDWFEPPRLRHQLALLLAHYGHHVTFVQKPVCLIPPSRNRSAFYSGLAKVTLLMSWECLHHQLRLFPALHRFNSWFARRDLVCRLESLDADCSDVIINFNYDAFWLRSVFPDKPIYTIINDDFEALSRLHMRHHITWALQRTCSISNRVLVVSEPLRQRLSLWCQPELFLPWASDPYQAPVASPERNVLLFWGYINERLDTVALKACLPALERLGLRLRFVGPLDSQGRNLQRQLGTSPVVEWCPPCSFNELKTSDCVAALIPYRLDCPGVEAIQLSNKALQLLSRGLPLITSALPNFHSAPYIFTYGIESCHCLADAALAAQRSFASVQACIAQFVDANGPEARLSQLLAGVR